MKTSITVKFTGSRELELLARKDVIGAIEDVRGRAMRRILS